MKLAYIQNDNWHTSPSERFSYYSFFFGQNAVYNLVSTLLTTYLLLLGLNAEKSAAVILAVKLWDAFNDVLFGVIFDKVKFKSGRKYLPWLKISAIAVPIATVLMFVIPDAGSETLKLAWLAIAYIIWDTAYTICDVPIYGIITVITENLDERTSMLSYKSIYGGAGAGFCTLIGTVLISEHVGSDFSIIAIIIGVTAAITMLPVAFKAKERAPVVQTEEFTVRKMFKYLVTNKYLLIYYLGFFFYSSLNVSANMTLFVSFYLFHDSLFSLIITVIGLVPSLVCALFVPSLIRRFDKMKIYLVCVVLAVVTGLVTFFVGYENIIVYTILATIKAMPLAVIGVMMFMFTPDCAEYGKYMTGIDAKGITFALQTFAAKLTGAIAGSLGLLLMGIFGWKEVKADNFEVLQQMNVLQSDTALFGLWFTYALVPVIGVIIAGIVWLFYRLTDKQVQIMADYNMGRISREDADAGLAALKFKK